jgi:guanine deaminase
MRLTCALLDVPGPEAPRFVPRAELEADAASGRITRVTALPPAAPPDTLVIPGLIDAHAHLPQYPVVARQEASLLPWLERHVFPAERRFTTAQRPRAELAAEIDFFFADLGRHGITTAVLYSAIWEDSTRLAFETAARRGHRAVIGKVMMDEGSYGESQPVRARDLSLAETRRLAAEWHGANGGLLDYAVSPRFAVTCSAELLRGAAAIARDFGCYLQTHLAENPGEIAAVRARFPEAIDYTEVYDRAGLLGPRTILGHCIHLSPREIDTLAARGARVAHCPTSNLFLHSGLCPLDRLRRAGIPVALASDVAGGPELNPFQVMRAAIEVQQARAFHDPAVPLLTPADAFHLATSGAAEVLGKQQLIGTLDPGKAADWVELDLAALLPHHGAYQDLARLDAAAILSLLVHRGGPHAIRRTLVQGKVVFDRERPEPLKPAQGAWP